MAGDDYTWSVIFCCMLELSEKFKDIKTLHLFSRSAHIGGDLSKNAIQLVVFQAYICYIYSDISTRHL